MEICMPHCFFFNDTATTEIYTLSLHDALPISRQGVLPASRVAARHRPPVHRAGPRRAVHAARLVGVHPVRAGRRGAPSAAADRKEHTSELQSRQYLVCRLLLEKKNKSSSTLSV